MALHKNGVLAGFYCQVIGQSCAIQRYVFFRETLAHHHGIGAALLDDGFLAARFVGVIAHAAAADVDAGTADEHVLARAANLDVVAFPAQELVVAALSFENIRALAALDDVLAGKADDPVRKDEFVDIASQHIALAGADDALRLTFKIKDRAVLELKQFDGAIGAVKSFDAHDQLARGIDFKIKLVGLRLEKGHVR